MFPCPGESVFTHCVSLPAPCSLVRAVTWFQLLHLTAADGHFFVVHLQLITTSSSNKWHSRHHLIRLAALERVCGICVFVAWRTRGEMNLFIRPAQSTDWTAASGALVYLASVRLQYWPDTHGAFGCRCDVTGVFLCSRHLKDVILLTAIVQVLSVISSYFWYLWLLVSPGDTSQTQPMSAGWLINHQISFAGICFYINGQ